MYGLSSGVGGTFWSTVVGLPSPELSLQALLGFSAAPHSPFLILLVPSKVVPALGSSGAESHLAVCVCGWFTLCEALIHVAVLTREVPRCMFVPGFADPFTELLG